MKSPSATDKRPAVLWLVAARSGSKRIFHKNIRSLGGAPLLVWRVLSALACRSALSSLAGRHIQSALASGRFLSGPVCGDKVWVSTDSEVYAEIARRYGADVPFLRPTHLSTDTTSLVDVCLHAMQEAENAGLYFDMLGLLLPTSPFVHTESLRTAVTALGAYPEAEGAAAVGYVYPPTPFVQPESPWLDVVARRMAAMNDPLQQATPAEITPCGGFYLMRWEALRRHRALITEKTLAVRLAYPETFTIVTSFDFDVAELMLTKERVLQPVTFPS